VLPDLHQFPKMMAERTNPEKNLTQLSQESLIQTMKMNFMRSKKAGMANAARRRTVGIPYSEEDLMIEDQKMGTEKGIEAKDQLIHLPEDPTEVVVEIEEAEEVVIEA